MSKNFILKDVEIFLDKDRKIFDMGEMVHGKLRISCSGELHLSVLQIGIVCMSKIKHADDTFDQKKLLEEFYELPRSGDTIQLKTLINNTTTLKVTPRAALYQTQIFMSGDRHRTLELVLVEPIEGSEVDPTEVIEDTIEMPIPTRAQLTMKSPIITIKYFVHVTLDIPHNIDLHINLPIVITNRAALTEAMDKHQPSIHHFNSFDDKPKSRKILGIASKARRASAGSSNFDENDDFD